MVIAGYNLLLTPSRSLNNLSKPNAKSSHFVSYWPTPGDPANWAVLVLVLVLGDIQIYHKKDAASKESKAGVGLSTLLQCRR